MVDNQLAKRRLTNPEPDIGLGLAERLNAMAGRPQGRRLVRLVENIQRRREMESYHPRAFPKLIRKGIFSAPSTGDKKEMARLDREIDRELRRCKTHPRMFDPLLAPLFGWVKPPGGWYTLAVLEIVQLANKHLLRRLRPCRTCSKWIFAKKDSQDFCGVACRQKHYQSDPDVKQRRRERMREYMRGYRAR